MEQKVAALLRLALGVITDRLLTIVALCMTFALATWIMNNPDWLRLCAFAVFCVCVFLPVLYKERNHEPTVQKPMYSERDDT
jgi:uncharacterized membrane protein